jgi:hypothetical protein
MFVSCEIRVLIWYYLRIRKGIISRQRLKPTPQFLLDVTPVRSMLDTKRRQLHWSYHARWRTYEVSHKNTSIFNCENQHFKHSSKLGLELVPGYRGTRFNTQVPGFEPVAEFFIAYSNYCAIDTLNNCITGMHCVYFKCTSCIGLRWLNELSLLLSDPFRHCSTRRA